jgi:hypothetical protein
MSFISNRPHRRLRAIADQVVSRADLGSVTRTDHDDLAARIIAIAAGRYQQNVTAEEATLYLDAKLAERGFPLSTRSHANDLDHGPRAIPAPRIA